MSEPSAELVEEIARTIRDVGGVFLLSETSEQIARAVLASPSIARALEKGTALVQNEFSIEPILESTPSSLQLSPGPILRSTPSPLQGGSALAQKRDDIVRLLVLDFLKADAAYRRDLGIYGHDDKHTISSEQHLWWARNNLRGWYGREFGTDDLRDLPPIERSESGGSDVDAAHPRDDAAIASGDEMPGKFSTDEVAQLRTEANILLDKMYAAEGSDIMSCPRCAKSIGRKREGNRWHFECSCGWEAAGQGAMPTRTRSVGEGPCPEAVTPEQGIKP